jgi:hypothetical protein
MGDSMKKGLAVAGGLLAVLVGPGFSTPLSAQESAKYAGELTAGCSSYRGRTVEIEIRGNTLRGTIIRGGNDNVRFSGELKDSSFNITTKNQTPIFIRGAVDGETIRATFDRQECSYKAVLKKKT